MLFNSYPFLCAFLPMTWVVHQVLEKRGLDRAATAFLALASLAFYAWWSVKGLFLLVVLMLANYAAARWLAQSESRSPRLRRAVLIGAIAGNLAVLAYFKYANFFLETWAAFSGSPRTLLDVALPLGISFFTFQKIALLVDAYRGEVDGLDPLGFALFVSFFPQLIAGPIVHHREVMGQFRHRRRAGEDEVTAGLMILAIGLAKKVLVADNLAPFATPVFNAAAAGSIPGAAEAWAGALAYTLQLYFDFSGYSDMAVGAALMFGVRLPVNFASPYKATSIIDFWRRWHMTLSRFLRDYLYVPLGGNRRGPARRYVNLFLTMLLGGLWHGAGWNFVFWGGLHGAYLAINHGWSALLARRGLVADRSTGMKIFGTMATFLAVVIGWVFFRAADMKAAVNMLSGMVGAAGGGAAAIDPLFAAALIAPLLALVWIAPNSMEIVGYSPNPGAALGRPFQAATPVQAQGWALGSGLVLAASLISLTHVSEFLYFQF